jgi:hypothetical protein
MGEYHVPFHCKARSLPSWALAVLLLTPVLASAQISGKYPTDTYRMDSSPQVNSKRPAATLGTLVCPGGFPTDLTVTNCDFTPKMRVQQWVTVSLTDEAMLGAVVYGVGAQIIQSPGEWRRTWGGYGDRIGVRYTQAAARGTAEFLVGSLMRDDPRHVSYKDDPNEQWGTKITKCEDGTITIVHFPSPGNIVWKRIGHAFVDSVTVRQSTPCGIGKRLPAIDRLVGVSAGAYGGYAWYPAAENTLASAGQRAALSYSSTLLGSFYTEFSPELSTLLSKIFSSHKKSQPWTQ